MHDYSIFKSDENINEYQLNINMNILLLINKSILYFKLQIIIKINKYTLL